MRLHKKNKKGRVINMDKQIILASGSPRRKELMTLAGYTFEVKVSEKEEHYKSNVPEEIVKELALQKAEDVAERTEKKKLAVIGECEPDKTGTKVTFFPDDTIFEETVFDYRETKDRRRSFCHDSQNLRKDTSSLYGSGGVGFR